MGLVQGLGLDLAEFVEFCNEAADCGCLFSGDVREGYVEAIDAVALMGHEIIICTDRSFGTHPGVSQGLTVAWLHQHEIDYDELIFSADKTVSNCDFAIDDKLENYDALVAAGCKAFLLNRPWNKVEGGDARNRIDGFDEYRGGNCRGHREGLRRPLFRIIVKSMLQWLYAYICIRL